MAGSTHASHIADGSLVAAPALSALAPAPQLSLAHEAWRRFRRHRLALVSAALLCAIVVVLLVVLIGLGAGAWAMRATVRAPLLPALRRE